MICLVLLLCPTPSLAQELDRRALGAIVEPYLEEQSVPGAVVSLIIAGKPGAIEAFGLANLALGEAMTRSTRFQVGSVTKPLTAALIAQLVQQGRLDYGDPIAAHLPEGIELADELARISLSELLTHSSGLPREPINRKNLENSPSVMLPMAEAELLEGLLSTKLESPAGETWSYSNLGYGLLGAIASEAGGDSYARLLERHVLAPLGMLHSAVYLNEAHPKGLAACYWPEDDKAVERDPWVFGSVSAFSGLVSDAADLTRFLCAQLETGSSAHFSTQSLAYLHTPQILIDKARGRAMAPGWFVDPMPGGLVAIGHGGEVDGHSAVIAFFPGPRAGLVVLCNKGGKSAENLAFALMGALLGRMMEQGH